MPAVVPQVCEHTEAQNVAVLQAPAHWRQLDFISDLHLQADEPATFAAWQSFMQSTQADAVFILGDLFEVWVGDDVLESTSEQQNPGFESRCVQVLKSASQRLKLYLLHGNRDFLLSDGFAKASGANLLDDPSLLEFDGARWLLSHGDALCLEDTDYLAFREHVRSPAWQQAFLSKPLAERQAIARSMRAQSELRKKSGVAYADVDDAAARQWLEAVQASTLIHGHTHKPADHTLIGQTDHGPSSLHRIVLSDWDAQATPPRTEILRLSVARPAQRIRV